MIACTLLAGACTKNDAEEVNSVTKKEVIDNYAALVHQNYLDSYNSALTLQATLQSFTNNPTQDGFDQAKTDWLAARDIYGQTEVFRGSDE